VLLSGHAVLGPALEVGLAVLGWAPTRAPSWLALDDRARSERGTSVVLVVDEDGTLPAGPPPGAVHGPGAAVLALGRRQDLPVLVGAVERGAVAVVDCEQPFVDLLDAVDRLLLDPDARSDRTELAHRLRARIGESELFAAMTRRELEILTALLRGSVAAEIARADHVAMPTVRTHIQSILTKSGVQAQVEVIALAHRSATAPVIVRELRQVHQF